MDEQDVALFIPYGDDLYHRMRDIDIIEFLESLLHVDLCRFIANLHGLAKRSFFHRGRLKYRQTHVSPVGPAGGMTDIFTKIDVITNRDVPRAIPIDLPSRSKFSGMLPMWSRDVWRRDDDRGVDRPAIVP